MTTPWIMYLLAFSRNTCIFYLISDFSNLPRGPLPSFPRVNTPFLSVVGNPPLKLSSQQKILPEEPLPLPLQKNPLNLRIINSMCEPWINCVTSSPFSRAHWGLYHPKSLVIGPFNYGESKDYLKILIVYFWGQNGHGGLVVLHFFLVT